MTRRKWARQPALRGQAIGSVLAIVCVISITGCAEHVQRRRSIRPTVRARAQARKPPRSHTKEPETSRTAAAKPLEHPYRVVLGESVGPVRLGMKEEEAITVADRAWGPGSLVNDTPYLRNRQWLGAVNVQLFPKAGDWLVTSITVSDSRFKTPSGFGVGTSYAAAKTLLGKPLDVLWVPRDAFGPDVPGYGAVQWPGLEVDITDWRVADFRIYSRGSP